MFILEIVIASGKCFVSFSIVKKETNIRNRCLWKWGYIENYGKHVKAVMYLFYIDIFMGPIEPHIWSLPDWEVFP